MPVRWPTTPFRPLNLRWCGAPAQSARDKALRLDAPAGKRRLDLAIAPATMLALIASLLGTPRGSVARCACRSAQCGAIAICPSKAVSACHNQTVLYNSNYLSDIVTRLLGGARSCAAPPIDLRVEESAGQACREQSARIHRRHRTVASSAMDSRRVRSFGTALRFLFRCSLRHDVRPSEGDCCQSAERNERVVRCIQLGQPCRDRRFHGVMAIDVDADGRRFGRRVSPSRRSAA